MGSELAMSEAPRFRVRAVGSFDQRPGCPDDARRGARRGRRRAAVQGRVLQPLRRAPPDRAHRDRAHPPAARAGEPIASLIDDPFLVLPCAGAAAGCAVEFSDPEFPRLGRDVLYYARAYEAPELAINAGGIRCERDASGECEAVKLCPGPDGPADDCLAEREPRAWSSPIYLAWRPSAAEPTHQVAARE